MIHHDMGRKHYCLRFALLASGLGEYRAVRSLRMQPCNYLDL